METYNEQAKEIERLCKRIAKKASGFATDTKDSPYYGDLLKIISDLKESDSFLNDEYLKK